MNDGGAGNGAAGGNNGLYAFGGQKLHVLPRHLSELFYGLGAIGHAGSVTKVYYVFIGQKLTKGLNSGQTAEAGVKNSNGSVVH